MPASLIPLSCANCGAPLVLDPGTRGVGCHHCGQPFAVRQRSTDPLDPRFTRVGEGAEFRSLQEALSAVDDGATIVVEPGIYERCSFRRFGGAGLSAVRFAAVLPSRGSLLCRGCTFEHNFAGIALAGRSTHELHDCVFRSNAAAIACVLGGAAAQGVALDGRGNLFEDNERDLARLAP